MASNCSICYKLNDDVDTDAHISCIQKKCGSHLLNTRNREFYNTIGMYLELVKLSRKKTDQLMYIQEMYDYLVLPPSDVKRDHDLYTIYGTAVIKLDELIHEHRDYPELRLYYEPLIEVQKQLLPRCFL
jgi:hypothetical protein